LFGGGEAIAAADGGDFEVEGGVFRVGTFVDEGFGGGVLGADLEEFFFVGVGFAEMGAETALTVVDL
jgi:hypothetical protein